MDTKYRVTLITKSGQKFNFKWRCSFTTMSRNENPYEAMKKNPYIIVKETPKSITYVPTDSIDCVAFEEVKD